MVAVAVQAADNTEKELNLSSFFINEKKYYIGSGDIFKNAIKKYGKSNFFKEILEWFEIRKEASDAQEKYIKEFNTLVPNGYNISPTGGIGVQGCHSEETIQKLKNSNSGEKNGMFGKKHSEKTKKLQRELKLGPNSFMFGKTGKLCPNFGKHYSEETKKQWRKQRKGKLVGEKNPMYGKSNYSIWVEKYGEKIAEQKMIKRAEKASISLKDQKRTDEQIDHMKTACQTRKKPDKILCPYCLRELDPGNYGQFHGEKCKFKVLS